MYRTAALAALIGTVLSGLDTVAADRAAKPAPLAVAFKGQTKRIKFPVDKAAAQFARYLGEVVGIDVPCADWEKAPAADTLFLLTDAKEVPELSGVLDGKPLDAFVICYPFSYQGRTVCLLASHDAHAADYPAYWFLTKYLDVHWVGPGALGEVIPRNRDWRMPPRIDVLEAPQFEMRMWNGRAFNCRAWLAFSGRMGFHHALGHVFDPAKFGHIPEIYPLVGGKRYIPLIGGKKVTAGWQPCTSCPKSIEIAVEHVLERFRENPSQSTVSLSVNDGAGNVCECDGCRAQDARHPHDARDHSDRFFRFYNTVIERAVQQDPRAAIAVLGYGACRLPPQEVKVHPRVTVFRVGPSVEELRAWHAAGARPSVYFWLWDGGFLAARPDLQTLAEVLRESHRLGGNGCDSEIIAQWAVSAPKFYALSHLTWDTGRDPDQLLAEYCRLAYGEQAGAAVRDFFDRWYEIYRRQEDRFRTNLEWKKVEQLQHLTRDDLACLDAALARAAAVVPPGKERQRLDFLQIWYGWTKLNAQQYLASRELSDRVWLERRQPAEILDTLAATCDFTERIERMWNEQFAPDETGWLVDPRYPTTQQFYDDNFQPLRAGLVSFHETAADTALTVISQRLLKTQTLAEVVAWWQRQRRDRPPLAEWIDIQLRALEGRPRRSQIVNGNFEEFTPGDPPQIPGWQVYQEYGTAAGEKARYELLPGSGPDGSVAIALGEGRFPELRTIVGLAPRERYLLTFQYKTENRERPAQLWLFRQLPDGRRPQKVLQITLEPTGGQWVSVSRVFTVPQPGKHLLQLSAYGQEAGTRTWFDNLEIRRR